VGLLACHWVLIGHHCHTTDLTFGLFICHTISFCPNFYLYCWDCRIFLLISWQLLTRPTTCRVAWGHFCSFLNIFLLSIMLQLKLRFFWKATKIWRVMLWLALKFSWGNSTLVSTYVKASHRKKKCFTFDFSNDFSNIKTKREICFEFFDLSVKVYIFFTNLLQCF
jgi:hypothetical protein